jgi:pyridoxal phosphate enzyme (YggS family)
LDREFREKYHSVLERVEASRKKVSLHHIVQIVAVTKYVTEAEVRKLLSIGQRAIGESRVQELENKISNLEKEPIEWHFIGNLQKNKINKFLELKPSLFHGLDSIELAEALQTRLEKRGENLNALLQINSSREPQKSGVSPEKAIDTYNEISDRFPNIKLNGVMSIGKNSENYDEVRKSFAETRNIFDKLQNAETLSMGMSGDFEIAIEEGSNLLRLGSILTK